MKLGVSLIPDNFVNLFSLVSVGFEGFLNSIQFLLEKFW